MPCICFLQRGPARPVRSTAHSLLSQPHAGSPPVLLQPISLKVSLLPSQCLPGPFAASGNFPCICLFTYFDRSTSCTQRSLPGTAADRRCRSLTGMEVIGVGVPVLVTKLCVHFLGRPHLQGGPNLTGRFSHPALPAALPLLPDFPPGHEVDSPEALPLCI